MGVTATREFEVNPLEGSVTPAAAVTTDEKPATPSPNTGQPKKKTAAGKKASGKKPASKAADAAPDAPGKPHTFRAGSKAEIILKKLKTVKGAPIDELIEATGWQSHSVRGFISGTVKKKLGLEVASEPGKDGVRRYRITVAKSGK